MRDAGQVEASSGLFCLALFLALALAGVLYIEYRLARAGAQERSQVDGD